MTKKFWMTTSIAAGASILAAGALGQYNVPQAPAVPQYAPPVPPPIPGQMGIQPAENIAATEMRIGLQKAQIQSAMLDRVAQIKQDNLKALQAKGSAGNVDQETLLNAEADAINARAAADSAHIDLNSMDIQNRAGPAALQQAQNAGMQQGGVPAQASPLVAQLMQLDLKKVQIQASTSVQLASIRQKIYDTQVAQQKKGNVDSEKISDALVDLEAAKAAQQTAALDEQLMNARLTAAGVRK